MILPKWGQFKFVHQLSFQSQMKQLQMQVDQNAKSAKHEWIRGLRPIWLGKVNQLQEMDSDDFQRF